jgi:hypothetical protein
MAPEFSTRRRLQQMALLRSFLSAKEERAGKRWIRCPGDGRNIQMRIEDLHSAIAFSFFGGGLLYTSANHLTWQRA